MLLVKTYLGKSKIHGLGLFAGEFIPKGKLVWEFVPGFDFMIKDKDFKKLPDVAKSFVLHFGYYEKNEKRHVINPDNARFFNHSKNPNVIDLTKTKSIAKRNIKKDEELTCNYFDFDDEAGFKLSKL
ncbi:MAG: SET domain-containing protein [Nanoarchaeota archaeon]